MIVMKNYLTTTTKSNNNNDDDDDDARHVGEKEREQHSFGKTILAFNRYQ